MLIQENIPLAPYTTFHIGGPARFFAVVSNQSELSEAVQFATDKEIPVFILGGGSNMLISDGGFDGLVIKLEFKGKEIIEQDDETVTIKIAAGEKWDDIVAWVVDQHFWGFENLSHIPGTVGALPVQNVGAYGQEASDTVVSVAAFDRLNKQEIIFSADECSFNYRQSIFNTTAKDRYVITAVVFRLYKQGRANVSYGDVAKYFADRAVESPSLMEMRKAIIEIRNTKFPYPDKPTSGNAGSFFKGPVLSDHQFQDLALKIKQNFSQEIFDRLMSMSDRLKVKQGYKTPGAFLIDMCGLKGYQVGGAKINESQPAIILNASGAATARDVIQLFHYTRDFVREKTGVELLAEPVFVGDL